MPALPLPRSANKTTTLPANATALLNDIVMLLARIPGHDPPLALIGERCDLASRVLAELLQVRNGSIVPHEPENFSKRLPDVDVLIPHLGIKLGELVRAELDQVLLSFVVGVAIRQAVYYLVQEFLSSHAIKSKSLGRSDLGVLFVYPISRKHRHQRRITHAGESFIRVQADVVVRVLLFLYK